MNSEQIRYVPTVVTQPTQPEVYDPTTFRVSTGLSGQDMYVSEDGYVSQDDDFSCAVASVVNAVWAIGGSVPQQMSNALYAEAARVDDEKDEKGLFFSDVLRIINKFPESGIRATAPTEDRTLVPIEYPVVKEVIQSARFVYDTINSGSAILASLAYPDGTYHAIAVVGYSLDDNGYMMVQYVDSGVGKALLTPLETLLLNLDVDGEDGDPSVLVISIETEPQLDIIDE